MKVMGNSLAPIQVFNAFPSQPFSAAAELASLRHPRRPTSSGSLEGQLRKAKPSMVTRLFPIAFSNFYLESEGIFIVLYEVPLFERD
jgi:hypothetical protein